jgi:hypothetical protein
MVVVAEPPARGRIFVAWFSFAARRARFRGVRPRAGAPRSGYHLSPLPSSGARGRATRAVIRGLDARGVSAFARVLQNVSRELRSRR